MIWLTLALLVAMVAMTLVSRYLDIKERRSMTVSKFVSRSVDLGKKDDGGKALSAFMVKHLAFAVRHKEEISSELEHLKNTSSEDSQT